MAQFDIYKRSGTANLLLDCQSDLLSDLPTRFLVPLVPTNLTAKMSPLNPLFEIGNQRYVLAPQLALSVPLERLGSRVGSLRTEHYAIIRAIDILLGGV